MALPRQLGCVAHIKETNACSGVSDTTSSSYGDDHCMPLSSFAQSRTLQRNVAHCSLEFILSSSTCLDYVIFCNTLFYTVIAIALRSYRTWLTMIARTTCKARSEFLARCSCILCTMTVFFQLQYATRGCSPGGASFASSPSFSSPSLLSFLLWVLLSSAFAVSSVLGAAVSLSSFTASATAAASFSSPRNDDVRLDHADLMRRPSSVATKPPLFSSSFSMAATNGFSSLAPSANGAGSFAPLPVLSAPPVSSRSCCS
mmetsp:Transcript_20114/g.55997  ORF Transcript_20114/g.55997 Transcript_20114/m.55997 type:complete len:258 (+) Transcript_20114:159-932(+)